MKKILLAISLGFFALNAFAQTVNENYIDGKIYFKLKDDAIIQSSLNEDPRHLSFSTIPFMQKLGRQFGITNLSRPFFAAKESHILQSTYEIKFTDLKNADKIVAAIKADPSVDYVEKAAMRRSCVTPNDPNYSSQWELAQISASTAWDFSTGSTAITVAIVDDAIEVSHPDLSPSIWTNTAEVANNGIDDDNNGYIDDRNGFDVADNDKDPAPPTLSFNHGTHVAGAAAAKSNNGIGVASIGYNIRIIPIKCTTISTALTNGLDGIVYAAVVGAKVINMSWGGSVNSTTEQNILDYAYSKGCVLVAGVGNSNSTSQFYPAAMNHVIAVGATASNDSKASYSNYGSWIDVCAPGDNIFTTDVGSTYGYKSGTSFSSPIVAGLCGLLLSRNPGLTQADVETCIKSNADNIDAVNSSYIGQLGAGRINANASMLCVNASLLWKPTANFYANITTVTAGGKVNFKDSTIHSATSWFWTFSGGTPASHTGKTPPLIQYNTPGTYDVTLTAGNGNGNDIKTRTGYIVVTAGGGCDIINWSKVYPTPTWSATYYTAGTGGADGFVLGKNSQDGGTEIAQYFDASSSPYTKLSRTFIRVYKAYSTNMNKVLTIKVYDGTTGTPGALLGSTTKTMQDCKNAINASRYLDVDFPTPITLPASNMFFISVDYSTLAWNGTTKDSLTIISNVSGQTIPSAVWIYRNSAWGQFNTTAGYWLADISMHIFPFLTDKPEVATFTTSAVTICEGSSITYNATGSTYEDTLLWYLPGSTANLSNSVTPTGIYNTFGTYTAKLYIVGGGCSELDSADVSVLVEANPTISVSSAGNTVCPGGNLTLTASGGTGLTWSPSTFLNTSSGATVITTPTSDITYNVTGTQGSCTGSATINIDVLSPVTVSVTTNPVNTTFCADSTVIFNASASTNVSNYTWSFPGGNPSSSSSATPSVNYTTSGTYTATLIASNSCGSDNSYSKVINAQSCVGVEEFFSAENINAFYADGKCYVKIFDNFGNTDKLSLQLFNHIGQTIYTEDFNMTGTQLNKTVELNKLASGIYTVQVSGTDGSYHRKLFVE